MDTIKAIFERYSYRGHFESTPIAHEDLKLIMEAGLAAPSGNNSQTTSLIGLDDPKVMEAMAVHLTKRYPFASAPAAICVLSQRISGYEDIFFNIQDYSAAIENMLLTITALGYASCWVEGHIRRDNVKETNRGIVNELGIPDGYELVAYLPIGIPIKKDVPRAKKKPFEERAWFNGFGK